MASNNKNGSNRPSSGSKPAGKATRKPKKPVTIDLMATPVDGAKKGSEKGATDKGDQKGQSTKSPSRSTAKQSARSVPKVTKSTDSSPASGQKNAAEKTQAAESDPVAAKNPAHDKPKAANNADKPAGGRTDKPAGAPSPQTGFAQKLGAGLAGGIIALAGAWVLQTSGIWPSGVASDFDGPTRLARLEEQINTRLVTLEKDQKTTMPDGLAALETRLAGLEASVNNSTGQSDGTARTLANTTGQLADISTSLSKLASKVADLESSVSSGDAGENAGLAALASRVDVLDAKVSENSSPPIKDLAPDIAELNDKVATAETRVAAGFDRIDQKIAAIEAAINKAEKGIAGLFPRIGKLENTADAPGKDEQKVARALALTGLKAGIDTGKGFEQALGLYENLSGDREKTAALREFAKSGIPTSASIAAAFAPVAEQIIKATAPKKDEGVVDRFFNNARSLVKVKTIGAIEGDGVDAIVSRIADAVKNSDLATAIEQWNALPEAGRAVSQNWIKTVKARHQADAMIGDLVKQFMAGMAGTGN